MFLAINELLKEKTRFALIVALIALVSYLTFFLTALAYGLASSYTNAISKWDASGIILLKDANNNIARSIITNNDYKDIISDKTALLGVGNATISSDSPKDVALFGIENGSFVTPNVTSGRMADANNEVVVSDQLIKSGVELNEDLKFKGSETSYKVVGFTDNATFQTAPVVYMSMNNWRDLASDLAGMIGMKDETTVSAIVTRGESLKNISDNSKLSWQPIVDYYYQLPGYKAQVLTFGTMIGFLIAIASFVLAIFMYILTIQKKSMFGVLKAVGVPNKYIVQSVNMQIIVLTALGMIIGLAFTLLTGMLLSGKVPFAVQPVFFVSIAAGFMIFCIIGGIASVRAVTKIDPAEAIS